MPTVKAKSISQRKLRRLAELEEAVKELGLLRKEVLEQYRERVPVQPGRYDIAVVTSAGKRSPKWKDEFVKEVKLGLIDRGEAEEQAQVQADKVAEKIIAQTKPGAGSTSIKLVDKNAL